jgi:hypothetical protein
VKIGRVVGGERPRQARDRGLAGVVLQVAAACYDGTHRGDVDDGARVAAHQRNRRLGTEEVAHQVDVEDLFPARGTRFVDLLVFADAGIVDEDVEAPELLRGTVDEVEACGLGTNVSLREGDLGAGGLELSRHPLAALAVSVAERHARALGEETPDRRLADPPCSAPSPLRPCRRAYPCSPPFTALRNAVRRIHPDERRLIGPAWVSDLNRLQKRSWLNFSHAIPVAGAAAGRRSQVMWTRPSRRGELRFLSLDQRLAATSTGHRLRENLPGIGAKIVSHGRLQIASPPDLDRPIAHRRTSCECCSR